MRIAVSACLLGQNCKYNGGNNFSSALADFLKGHEVVPLCPEARVFPVPRPKIERRGNTVVNEFGEDVTASCSAGVEECVASLGQKEIDLVILKARSPTCGVKEIYDGTFSGVKIPGQGLLAEALIKAGYRVVDEEDLLREPDRFFSVEQSVNDPLIKHYDALLAEGNDPVKDPPALRAYMNRWDGEPFLDALKLNPSSCVLEIGVGTGRLALRTAPLCGSFTGIDLAPETAKKAAEYLCPHAHAKIVCGDFLIYPFEERFDVIYSSLTFFHFAQKESAVRKIASLLRAGGRVVLSLEKVQRDSLDCGFGRIPLYPDDPSLLKALFSRYGMGIVSEFETEFATVLVAVKK